MHVIPKPKLSSMRRQPRYVAARLLMIWGGLGLGCNSILGIEAAELSCTGSACDAGVSSSSDAGLAAPGQPPAVSTPGLGSSEGTLPATTPLAPAVSVAGDAGTSAAANGSNSGAPEGSGDPPPGNSNAGSGNPGSGNDNGGSNNSGGNNGGGNPGAGAGGSDDGAAAPPVTPVPDPIPPPPVVPTGPCAGVAPGIGICDGAIRISCGLDSTVQATTPCPSPQHCEQGRAGECAVCLAGESRCEGAVLLTCNELQSGFTELACAAAELCDAVGATCRAPACLPGEARCVGARLDVCNASLSALDPVLDCASPQLCNAAAARCDACAPSTRRCANSTTVATCSATGDVETLQGCGLLQTCSGGECGVLGFPLF
jgi:hypothetical protein